MRKMIIAVLAARLIELTLGSMLREWARHSDTPFAGALRQNVTDQAKGVW